MAQTPFLGYCIYTRWTSNIEMSSAKKITQFKFSSFQENILCKDNRYLLEEKR